MLKLLPFLLLAGSAFAQYTTVPAGPAPSDVSASVSAMLQKDGGIKVMNGDRVYCEIWMRSSAPNGAKSAEDSVSLPNIPQGSLLGVIRVGAGFSDRRGGSIKPGVYTLRYSNYPQNGDHQGVAPQRDFALLSKASDDQDGNATPGFKALVDMSEKATGRPHPGVLSMWKVQSDFKAGLAQQGEQDWVLQIKVGDVPVAIILSGKAEG